MNTTLVLMRHGKVKPEVNDSDKDLIYGPYVRLSPEGRDETRSLAKHLSGVAFDVIYSSTTPRAVDSTQLLMESLRYRPPRVVYSKNLRAIRCPGWVGQPVEDAAGENGFPSFDRPGDEKPAEFADRVWNEFLQIITTNREQTIGIMGHGEGIGLIMHKLRSPKDAQLRVEGSIPTGTALKVELNLYTRQIEKEARIPEVAYRGKEMR